jgi:hypothetical protein
MATTAQPKADDFLKRLNIYFNEMVLHLPIKLGFRIIEEG